MDIQHVLEVTQEGTIRNSTGSLPQLADDPALPAIEQRDTLSGRLQRHDLVVEGAGGPARAAAEAGDVGDVLEVLAEERAVLITNGTADAAVGMVTISDLNRHSVRKALYDLVSEVESRLATLLVHTLDDEEHALRYLGELDQIRLLGHYHFMRQEGVELSLLAGATLSQLLRIAREEPAVLEKLGYGKSKFKDLTGSLPDLRNQVMHPVRPLIHSREDVAQLLRRVHRLDELRTRLRRALGDVQGAPLL